MADEKITGISASEDELNELFKETLDGIRDDIVEAKQNVDMYFGAIQDESGGKEMYGPAYNEALKIKGNARARQLSFLGMFKDRVAVKEKISMIEDAKKEAAAGAGIAGFDHTALNKYIEEYEATKNNLDKPIITTKPSLQIEDDFEDDEDDDDFEDDNN
jgi:hypothetical protein